MATQFMYDIYKYHDVKCLLDKIILFIFKGVEGVVDVGLFPLPSFLPVFLFFLLKPTINQTNYLVSNVQRIIPSPEVFILFTFRSSIILGQGG